MPARTAAFRVISLAAIALVVAAALVAYRSVNGPPLKLGGAGLSALHKSADSGSEEDLAGNRGEPDLSDATVAEEEAANRAIPLDSVPLSFTQAAKAAFDNIDRDTDKRNRRHGTWSLLGPSTAFQPGVLTFTGADYVTSGRVTSIAVAPDCSAGHCRVWVAAAGGGIWRTEDGLATQPQWRSVSRGLTTNAIGTIVLDPSDPGGNTLYVGTGEPNASGDSEAGLGLFRSDNGGESWSLVDGSFAVSRSRAISSLVVDPTDSNVLYMGTTRAVRGISSVTGGTTTVDPNGQPQLGLYKSTDRGRSWSLIWDGAGTVRGVNHVELDPADHSRVFGAAFQEGLWRSESGGPFKQILAPGEPANNANRTEFAVTGKNGHTRVYAGDGTSGGSKGKTAFYRSDNADAAAPTFKNLTSNTNGDPGYATSNYCTGQCWYDNYIFTPAGQPDTVFVLGSYQYSELGGRSNSRAILRSKTAGEPDPAHNNRTFTDLSWDATSASTPNGVHPDQHALALVPGNSDIWFEGSDGGVIRSSGDYTDISGQCDSRPIAPASMLTCHRLLSEVPTRQFSLNAGLATLQFQSLSIQPRSNDREIMGGTQDNGTWLFTGNRTQWNQTIYGDGGQSGFDVANPRIRFNTFFVAQTDTNFQGGDPAKWVVTSGPLLQSKEASAFYIPIIADPTVGGTMFAGLQHVWRTKDDGGNQAFLEANCPEFTTPSDKPTCGDWVPIGNDLTGPAYGTDRTATPGLPSFVVATARTKDSSTLWVATRQGRVFVSHNADAANPGSVTFTRIDNLDPHSPGRFVSGITIDPANGNHAWISYSGYNAATPSTPGHVFDVTFTPGASPAASFRNLEVESINGDLPVTGLVRDDARGDLFASTDFGVLTSSAEVEPHWAVAGGGLPRVEVAGLTISPATRSLYAATHGRGAWVMRLRNDNQDHQ